MIVYFARERKREELADSEMDQEIIIT